MRSSSTGSVIAWFTLRRIRRGAIILGIIFGIAVTSQTIGLVKAYPSLQERGAVIHSLGSNIGLQVIFGSNEHLTNSVGSYATWRVLGVLAIVGSIWALLITTRTLRGEEEQGRWEMLTSGPTTQRRATGSSLLGLYGGVLVAFIITAVILTISGRTSGVHLSAGASIAYAATLVMAPTLFVAIGALTSQLAGTRQQAAMLGTIFLVVCFMLRAIGNLVDGAAWLRVINPFCWVDNVLPFTDQHFIWFVPMAVVTVGVAGAAVWLSGRRDLFASHIKQRETAPMHRLLLRNPWRLALRLTRVQMLSWLLGLSLLGFMFGSLAKTAVSAFQASGTLTKAVSKVTQQTAETNSIKIFLGLAFFMLCVFILLVVTTAVNAVRNEESQNTLDNLLVQPLSRWRWLGGRLVAIVGWVLACGLATCVVPALAMILQGNALPFTDYLKAALNLMPMALFMIGCGWVTFGWLPRFTALALYGVIAWSFLLEILGQILNLNHWILDTSLLHHLAAVPAVVPVWRTSGIIAGVGIVLLVLGFWGFSRRDLQTE